MNDLIPSLNKQTSNMSFLVHEEHKPILAFAFSFPPIQSENTCNHPGASVSFFGAGQLPWQAGRLAFANLRR